jgi:dephospho-CoA kinase
MGQTSIIVGVAGKQGAGKSTLGSLLREEGITVIEFGDVIREEASRLATSSRDFLAATAAIKRKHGSLHFAQKVLEKVQELDGRSAVILVNGIRGASELQYLRDHIPGFVLIGIEASQEIRMIRVLALGGILLKPRDTEEFLEKEKHDEERLQIESVLSSADYTILNSGEIAEMREKFFRFLRGRPSPAVTTIDSQGGGDILHSAASQSTQH